MSDSFHRIRPFHLNWDEIQTQSPRIETIMTSPYHKSSSLLTPFVASAIAMLMLSPPAALAETWFEDFTDGSFSNNPHLDLEFLRMHELRADGLVIETPTTGPAATLVTGLNKSDSWSIRTQGRLLQDRGFFGPVVAPTVGAAGSLWAQISSIGLGMGSLAGGESISGSNGFLNPSEEDVVIQFDVFNGTAQLWSWAADDPPLEEFEPMLEGNYPLTIGFPGVWVRSVDPNSAVILRNLTISTEHIPIPSLPCEPSQLVGDIDGDGVVAFADFLVLSVNFGSEGNVLPANGDLDCDGTVAFSDFLLLSANFGASAGGAIRSVPEPSLWMWMIVSTFFGLSSQMRGRRSKPSSPER